MDRVTSPIADGMVTSALCYVTAETLPKIEELFGGELLDNDATERRLELSHLKRWLTLRKLPKVRECRIS